MSVVVSDSSFRAPDLLCSFEVDGTPLQNENFELFLEWLIYLSLNSEFSVPLFGF